ncbi:aspartate/glutamate racemase family protein [Knoellia sp. S7-12]|uniref:aspartate/glutamate racemase family protein n=1 Tax=Knoellia sp. S7-12 TaxID=3126698 RepID=UPI0033666B20
MRTLGVLGGMSWTSTESYYRLLNEGVVARLGGLHSAQLLLHSVDFDPVAQAQHDGDWDATLTILSKAAQGLARGGAEALLIATNTMHKVADELEEASGLPVLHIADATADAIVADGVSSVGLLATAFTMEQDFYVGRLRAKGLDAIVPDAPARAEVHRIIYDELCRDVVLDASRDTYRDVIASLVDQGAEAVILGCTEITLLVGAPDSTVPLYDTTRIHAAAGVEFMLG